MPKIEVFEDALFRAIDVHLDNESLEKLFTCAKAELDEPVNDEGIIKVELNDTNRPDLWSTAGLARQLRIYRSAATGGSAEIPEYDFFSRAGDIKASGERRIKVDPSVNSVRPWITGFAVRGQKISEAVLNDIIQTQEKLCWNFGRKRKAIAMGVYRSSLVQYPVQYKAVDPETTRFTPLGMDGEMSLREIIADHPKGQEYGHIVADMERMPFITDANDEVLSFPPIINSAKIGAVEAGDEELFIELTGTELKALILTASIVACDLADMGFEILPVTVEYPYDTPFGREITLPYYFQDPVEVDSTFVSRYLGVGISNQEVIAALARMGVRAQDLGMGRISVTPPEYRNDFLHPVDVAEDVMIGRGMDSFKPEMPSDFTLGRLTDTERFSRRVKTMMVGLGFQEMIFNYLGSGRDFIENMYPEDEWDAARDRFIQVANPLSENFEWVRPSCLPSLLTAEAVSANAAYPHKTFEVGKVVRRDDADNYGSVTLDSLAFVHSDAGAGFNDVHAQVSTLLYFIAPDFVIRELEDSRFIAGRSAEIFASDGLTSLGVFGEVHPRVLEAFGIDVPCTACELVLNPLVVAQG